MIIVGFSPNYWDDGYVEVSIIDRYLNAFLQQSYQNSFSPCEIPEILHVFENDQKCQI